MEIVHLCGEYTVTEGGLRNGSERSDVGIPGTPYLILAVVLKDK